MEVPQRLLGRDIFHWLSKTGLLTLPADSRMGHRLRARGDLVFGSRVSRRRREGVAIRPRLSGVSGNTACFADGSLADIDAVLWATGYRSGYSWIRISDALHDGQPLHHDGATAVPGLHFLGLPWMTSRGSALLGFVGRDAALVADRVMGSARPIAAAGLSSSSGRRHVCREPGHLAGATDGVRSVASSP